MSEDVDSRLRDNSDLILLPRYRNGLGANDRWKNAIGNGASDIRR